MTNPQQGTKHITISIVSHGQQELILPLLEQLERHCAEQIAKIVLTVNTPEPDLIAGKQWTFPVQPINNARPKGFGANHNAAFLHCETPWFLVLNPDVRLTNDALSALTASATPRAGLIAPLVRETNEVNPEPHRGLLTPMEILQRRQAGHRPPARPAWIPGLFMLFRSDAFQQTSGFDNRFFMYGEDFDICARLQLQGWELKVNEDLEVRHEAQRASHRSWRHLYWHITSLVKVWMSSAFWRYRASRRSP